MHPVLECELNTSRSTTPDLYSTGRSCAPGSVQIVSWTEVCVAVLQEVQAAENLVREVAIQQLAQIANISAVRVSEGLHCRALGSYCRGKEATGDIDMMVIPGDALSHICIRYSLSSTSHKHQRSAEIVKCDFNAMLCCELCQFQCLEAALSRGCFVKIEVRTGVPGRRMGSRCMGQGYRGTRQMCCAASTVVETAPSPVVFSFQGFRDSFF